MPKYGTIKKDQCALLVIDMQRYFCDESSDACVPGANKLITNIDHLMQLFQEQGRPIFLTRHIDDTTKGSLMFKWWSENILEDDPLSEIYGSFSQSGTMVIVKHQYDAFLHTDLEGKLQKLNVKQVVISGVLTNLCCESTARSAFMRGFEVFFIDDSTRTYTEDMHKATLLNLAYGFATITNYRDVVKTIGG